MYEEGRSEAEGRMCPLMSMKAAPNVTTTEGLYSQQASAGGPLPKPSKVDADNVNVVEWQTRSLEVAVPFLGVEVRVLSLTPKLTRPSYPA